ncbi:MAG: CZB domain-containing protein [Magnetococcus sp. DMHC-6]
MGVRLDLGMARNLHLAWEMDLEALTRGEKSSETLPYTRIHQQWEDCELGLWLHETGVRQYEAHDAIHQLVQVHKQFHQKADALLTQVLAGHHPGAWKNKFDEVRSLSREIVFLLTAVEFGALEKQRPIRRELTQLNPLQNLIKRLFEGPSRAVEQDQVCLDVSYARLMHMRWSQDLIKSFRHWGQDAHLDSAEICALGVWIHAVGFKKFSEISEIKMLDKVHKNFHEKAEKTIRELQKKHADDAQRAYNETLELSQEVIYLLSLIEYKLLNLNACTPTVQVFG